MKKTFLWMAAAIMTCGLAFTACTVEDNPNPLPLGEPDPDEWEIDFYALSQKYAQGVALTVTAAVYDNVGTTSIVNGTLKEPAEDGSETASEELDPRFAVQSGTNWIFHTNFGKTGLRQQNGGGRTFGVLDAKKDQIITIEVTEAPSVKSGNVDLFSTTDSTYTYYVNENCNVVFNLARYNIISKISVKKFYGAEYTVKFVNEKGEKVKDDVKHMGYINKPVELWPSDKEGITLESGKLIFKEADNTPENVVKKDGSTVITVVYREAEKYIAVLRCMAGSTQLFAFNDADKYWFYEGDELTIHPSRTYGKDGVYYTTPATTWNGTQVKFPGTITPTTTGGKTYYIATQNYEEDATIVYFANFEDLALPKEDAGNGTGLGQLEGTVNNWWFYNGPGYWERLDGGRGIRLDEGAYVWTEPIAKEGIYNVAIYGRNDGSNEASVPFVLGLRKSDGNIEWLDLTIPAWAGGNTGEKVIENVTIPAGNSLVVKNTDAANLICLDDIKVVKPAAE